jgi:O-acetylhomoserine/O-acetylserine sulfhydrylase-like pyridoxal-dependent enzyme
LTGCSDGGHVCHCLRDPDHCRDRHTVSSPYLCRPFEYGAGIEPIDDLLADLEQALAAV